MRASQDELESLFKQAFEACAYDFGRCEVAAELVVWSQMLGFNVFPVVKECLIPLDQGSLSINVLLDEPHSLVFDNQGLSVLVSASQIVNLGCAKALNHGFCVVQIQDCAHPIMLTKLLCDSRSLGLQVAAYWYEAQTQQTIELKAVSKLDYPELSYFSNSNDLNIGELSISFAKESYIDKLELTAVNNNLVNNACMDHQITAGYLAKQYQHSLNRGIEIETELWQLLFDTGARVLVESNQQSRQGAGS